VVKVVPELAQTLGPELILDFKQLLVNPVVGSLYFYPGLRLPLQL